MRTPAKEDLLKEDGIQWPRKRGQSGESHGQIFDCFVSLMNIRKGKASDKNGGYLNRGKKKKKSRFEKKGEDGVTVTNEGVWPITLKRGEEGGNPGLRKDSTS